MAEAPPAAPRAGLLLVLLLSGCIDHLLEAPYILATGVGPEPLAMSLTPRHSLLVGGLGGLREVDGSGAVQILRSEEARAVASHLGWLAFADAQGVLFQLDSGAELRVPLPEVRALQAWCDASLLALSPTGIWLLRPDGSPPRLWAAALPGSVDITLSPGPPCEAVLQLSPDALHRSDPQGSQPLASALEGARAVATDRLGRAWVLHGQPLVLAQIEAGQARTIARHVGDARDLSFGNGGLLHSDSAWLLIGDGRVDYLPVAMPPSLGE